MYGECTHLWSLLSKLPNVGWQEISEKCERKRIKSDLRLAGTDMKAFGGNRCIAPLIFNLSKKMEVSDGLRATAASPPTKRPLVLSEEETRLGPGCGRDVLQQRQVSLSCLESDRESSSSQPSPHTGYARTVLCCRQ